MDLNELSATRRLGAIVIDFRGVNTIPRSSVVLSTSALFFPVAIVALALLHFAFGACGLVMLVRLALGFA